MWWLCNPLEIGKKSPSIYIHENILSPFSIVFFPKFWTHLFPWKPKSFQHWNMVTSKWTQERFSHFQRISGERRTHGVTNKPFLIALVVSGHPRESWLMKNRSCPLTLSWIQILSAVIRLTRYISPIVGTFIEAEQGTNKRAWYVVQSKFHFWLSFCPLFSSPRILIGMTRTPRSLVKSRPTQESPFGESFRENDCRATSFPGYIARSWIFVACLFKK